ncbi:lipopolysaccharide heptosyltransferase II [Candidatus Blochmannia ocreatus (nom. nud.)]|uniref:lipopolysaccharide heptosyltransferase II n=1 Tax=Candidatus Blochmannia ocreatus (nom. nud.) TaxID=251538 RepID=A0ABY4SUK4_9ENTR|nr:lipopolysaccharide heptosyltransferase II [Candidatus Blochmannia ocreatus]URJ25074.1 lipopolysaccharide heptosyltransferase II [Candidatus Blochmannia ocreatus]
MKLLVISPSWLGDAVMSHSMYRLLVARYAPKSVRIDVVAPTWCKDVLNYMPEINKTFVLPYSHGDLALLKCYNFGKLLRFKNYQQAIVLPDSLKSALIPFFAKIPLRTGWLGEYRYGFLNDVRILNVQSFPLMIQRYASLVYNKNVVRNFCDLPSPLPYPCLDISETEISSVLCKFNLHDHRKRLIGLCPGTASGLYKSWPQCYYVTLAIQLIYRGYYIVILGAYQDNIISKFIDCSILTNLEKYYFNLIGRTSVKEVIAIIASCKAVVSNDSGLMHVASALQCPVVGIYGLLSNPKFTPPLYKRSIILRDISEDYYNKNLYGSSTDHYHSSLINIKPDRVLEALGILLS